MRGWTLTDQDLPTDGDPVLTLQQLIRARMDERGWSYGELEKRTGHQLTKGRWQQLGTGVRMPEFPTPKTIALIAEALDVDVTAVVLAAAQSLGLDVRRRGPDLAHLLPAGVDRLPPTMRDAILALIRAAVAETLERGEDGDEDDAAGGSSGGRNDLTLEWAERDAPNGRNAVRLRADRDQ